MASWVKRQKPHWSGFLGVFPPSGGNPTPVCFSMSRVGFPSLWCSKLTASSTDLWSPWVISECNGWNWRKEQGSTSIYDRFWKRVKYIKVKEKYQTIVCGRFKPGFNFLSVGQKVTGNSLHQSAESTWFYHARKYSRGTVKVNHTYPTQMTSLSTFFK